MFLHPYRIPLRINNIDHLYIYIKDQKKKQLEDPSFLLENQRLLCHLFPDKCKIMPGQTLISDPAA